MFDHLKYFTPFAGQLSLEWFWRCPHLRHPAPFCWLKGFFGLSENVENFVTSLYTLSEHCGYNDLREEMIRDRIVVGIKDANLSVKMQNFALSKITFRLTMK
jgi:hypothetical protein